MTAGTEREKKPLFVVFKFLVFITILLIIFHLIDGPDLFWRWVYPLKYEDLIVNNASRFELDPYLVAAIIYVESRFNPEASSHKGALGLMQIMPETGKWIASQLDNYSNEDFDEDNLLLPEKNILYGSWYLASLKEQFADQRTVVLAAYNAGRGNVSSWLEGEWDGREKTITDLPFAETRDFVQRVERMYLIYKKIYQAELGD